MRRTGRSALAQGMVSLAVMAAGVIVVATDASTPVAGAETVLGVVKNAKVVSPSGATRTAVAGDRLVNGDVVTTGSHGSAQLITRHRATLLGSLAAIAVVNGSRQQLRTGVAVVDALHGPALALDLFGDVVSIPRGSATEAGRGPSTRVGALSGPAMITSASGRRLAMTPLSQAVLSGDAVPGGTTPLHLTDSASEFSVVPGLVKDDIALKTLARGIDTTGRSTARVVAASWTGTRQAVPGGVNRSERVLPVLIADSTHGGTAQQRYNDAVAWRVQGGSWGVVLHLLSGRASAVETTLSALQRQGQAPGEIGNVAPTGSGVSAAGRGPKPVQPLPRTGNNGTHHPTGRTPSHPTGSAPPPPPDNLLGGLVSTVQTVIDGVLGVLPHGKTTKEPVYRPKPPTKSSSGVTADLTTKAASSASATTSKVAATDTATKAAASKAAASKAATTKAESVPTATPSTGLLGNLLGGVLHPQR